MAYDQGLAQRVRDLLEELPGYAEKKMFGGLAFLLYGNMSCGIRGEKLIVRVGPEAYRPALREEHVRPFDITGRPLTGWVMIAPAGCEADPELAAWVEKGVAFARTLPTK
jgi:hypothetical protein